MDTVRSFRPNKSVHSTRLDLLEAYCRRFLWYMLFFRRKGCSRFLSPARTKLEYRPSSRTPRQLESAFGWVPLNRFLEIRAHFFSCCRSLADCLHNASMVVPQDALARTPIFLRATAGMRVLWLDNPTIAEAILNSTLDAFAKTPFDSAASTSRILTGEEEGAYGWVASNYLDGNLEATAPQGLSLKENATAYIGALDMGGASTQVAITWMVPVNAIVASGCGVEAHLSLSAVIDEMLFTPFPPPRSPFQSVIYPRSIPPT